MNEGDASSVSNPLCLVSVHTTGSTHKLRGGTKKTWCQVCVCVCMATVFVMVTSWLFTTILWIPSCHIYVYIMEGILSRCNVMLPQYNSVFSKQTVHVNGDEED